MTEEEGEREFPIRVRKTGSGGIGGRRKQDSLASCSISGSEEEGGFFGIAPSSRNMGFSSQKTKTNGL